MTDYSDRPVGGSGPVLPPSRFGAGYTVGEPTPEPAPAYPAPTAYPGPVSYQPPAPEPPGALRYPDMPVQPTGPPSPVSPAPMVYAVPVQKTNSMAIAALVCSFVLAPLGIIFGHIALSQIKHTGEDGRGFAIAGLVIGYIFTGFALLWFIGVGMFLSALSSAADESNYNSTTTPATVSTILHTQPAALVQPG